MQWLRIWQISLKIYNTLAPKIFSQRKSVYLKVHFLSSALLSNLARCSSPRVQANIEATGFVDVLLP